MTTARAIAKQAGKIRITLIDGMVTKITESGGKWNRKTRQTP
jgi:hypothetical protein